MIRFRMLGAIELRDDRGRDVGVVLRRPKLLALLGYLAAARPAGFRRRDTLVALLWPALDNARARSGLRQAVHALRGALGRETITARGEEELGIDAQHLWCDARDLASALDATDPEHALELYRGPLLRGFHVSGVPAFEHWLEQERLHWERYAARAAMDLAARETAAGNGAGAVRWAIRLVEVSPYDETAVQHLISSLDRAGDRAAAVRAYEEFELRLARDVDLLPAPETRELIERIRSGPSTASRSAPRSMRAATSPAPSRTASPAHARPRLVNPLPAGLLVLAAAAMMGGMVLTSRGDDSLQTELRVPRADPRTALAVLPFQSLSDEAAHTHFAGGLYDELITQLSKVAALSVRGRTSMAGYAGTTKTARQIADELHVGALIQGSVQVADGRLRFNVLLIDAATDEHLWAESYDRTLHDAFAIQSEVAQRVVDAVGAALTGDERRALDSPPTANGEAYALYLQGREYHRRPGATRRNIEAAAQLYERALALDPQFALAHASLSEVHGLMHWLRYDPSPQRAARQWEHAQTARRLAPDLPQARAALGMAYYHGRRDWRRALAELEHARARLPGDSRLLAWIGYTHRRLGNWDAAAAALARATELDPRDADLMTRLAEVYQITRRYPEAVWAYDRSATLAPDFRWPVYRKALTYVQWQGELDSLRAVPDVTPLDVRFPLLLWERRADSLLRALDAVTMPAIDIQDLFVPVSLYAAWAHQAAGDAEAARGAFESALALLDSVVVVQPDDYRVRAARGLALAGLGRRTDALREATWIAGSTIYREDALFGPGLAEKRAMILAQAGDVRAALAEIERLLTRPSWLTVHTLRLDPRWDPIRDHPRFRALLERHAGHR